MLNHLEEAHQFVKVNDFERATRRLMDFGFEHLKFDSPSYERIFSFREKVNHFKSERLKDETEFNDLKRIGTSLIEELNEYPISVVKKNNDVQYISAKGIELIYGNEGKVHFHLGPIDFSLSQGEIIGVVGENGNGKTTLLRILAKLLKQTKGSLNYNLSVSENYDMRRFIAFVPQRVPKWNGKLIENLKFHASLNGFNGKLNEDRVNFIVNRLGLSAYKDLKWKELSSGYKLRFELAKILVKRAKVLILDEPLANLDLNAQQLFLEDLISFKNSYSEPLSIVLSSQQIHEVEKVADQMIFLKNGEVVFQGQTNSLDEDEFFEYELNGNFQFEDLNKILKGLEYQIKDLGTGFVIGSEKSDHGRELLSLILKSNLHIDYFRNVTLSTKKYFNQ